jgi:hypothetical protein
MSPSQKIMAWFDSLIPASLLQSTSVIGIMIVGALLAFELFNFSTTEFALTDLLGDLRFIGIKWATILALAFCGIDFAGIARLFTPNRKSQEPVEVWYLLGAWFLGATMNALLTWWSVSLALVNHAGLGNEIIGRDALIRGVPVFVAILVWLIRVLMIGTLSLTGSRILHQFTSGAPSRRNSVVRTSDSSRRRQRPSPLPQSARQRPAAASSQRRSRPRTGSQEPSYHPLPLSARDSRDGHNH